MKTLIINGSPRKNGGTSSIVLNLKESLNGVVKVFTCYGEKASTDNGNRF